jgi:hypothetical protein
MQLHPFGPTESDTEPEPEALQGLLGMSKAN